MSSTTQAIQLEPAQAAQAPHTPGGAATVATQEAPRKARNPAPYYLNIDEIPVMAPF